MNRKGFLFTLFLLFFFVSFILVLLAYKDWYVQYKDSSHALSEAATVAYVYDDIAQDFVQLNDMNDVEILRSGSNVTVSFLGLYNSSKNYTSLLHSYESTVENNYSQEIQMNMSLDSVAYGFSIPEYRVSTQVIGMGTGVGSSFSIFIDNYQNLTAINLTLLVQNKSKETATILPVGLKGTQTTVSVTILDSSGTNQVLKASKVLDGNALLQNLFQVRYGRGSLVTVGYGVLQGRNGVLSFSYDYNVTLLGLDLTFKDFNQTLHVNFNGSIDIKPQVSGVSQTQMIGIEG